MLIMKKIIKCGSIFLKKGGSLMRIDNNNRAFVRKNTDLNTQSFSKKTSDLTDDEIRLNEKEIAENKENLEKAIKAQNEMELNRQKMNNEKEKMKIALTCLEISRRIISGDSVPYDDHKFLLKNDPQLYGRSMSMRFPKSNPFKYRQLSDKEKSQSVQELARNIKISDDAGLDKNDLPEELSVLDSKAGLKEKVENLNKEKTQKIQAFQNEMKINREKSEDEKEKTKIRLTCLKISRSLISGDEVSRADKKYLLKHDPNLYSMSISMRAQKENPKKIQQISQKEKNRNEKSITDVINAKNGEFSGVTANFTSAQELFGTVLDTKF